MKEGGQSKRLTDLTKCVGRCSVFSPVAFSLGVASAWNEVAIFVVAGEEGVEVVEDGICALISGLRGTNLFLHLKVFLDKRSFFVSFIDKGSIGIQNSISEVLADLLGKIL